MFRSQRLLACPPLLKVTASQPIAKGAKGAAVIVLQDLLSDLGHVMPKSRKNFVWDGIFGTETDGAVRAQQQRMGLKADGMVGPLTLGGLDALILASPVLELLDIAQFKADQLLDRGRPLGSRSNAYW